MENQEKVGKGMVVWSGKVRLGKSYLQFRVIEFLSNATMLRVMKWDDRLVRSD